jgi:protein tyrosine kinase modulator
MITNRELTMDDYLAMLRRRGKLIMVLALLGPLVGYLAYLPVKKMYGKYTSESIVLVEGQKVPENMVQPVVSDDLQARIGMLRALATSDSEMRPVLSNLFPGKSAGEIDSILEDMRSQPQLLGPFADLSQITGSTVRRKPGQQESPGFKVSYQTSDPRDAQRVCEALTSKIVQKNLEFIQANAKGTVDVLTQGLEDAKRTLDDMDGKLAEFKKQHAGQLPTDQDSNLKMLMTLSQQQDAYTQKENIAQQDKAYNQSMLSQQLAAWNSTQSSTNPQTLQKQLSDMQAQLLSLQARYTEDHPDVVKAKADIQEVKKKLAEINKATSDAGDSSNEKASASEPIEIRQIRQQIHRDDDDIAVATRELKRLQQGIAQYQQHLSLSPAVEEQYKALTRDYENAAKSYQDLLTKKSTADLTAHMTNQAQGERMSEIQAASFPDEPSFPNRLMFIGGGLAAGLALGMGLAMWFELRDNSIRTEADAEAALELPMLVAVPWVGVAAEQQKNGKFWHRGKKQDEQKETLSV